MQEFTPSAPCASSELIHFRKRIGKEGIELIFQESIRVNNEEDAEDHHHDTAFIDSTVQEKNITYNTDAKLHKKIVKKLGLLLRQSYEGNLSWQRFRNHPNNRKKALKADRRLRTIAGILVRELKRNLKGNYDYDKLLGIFETILSQRRNSRKKIYSIHEPEVQCICNGKEHKKYGFGNKVSIIRSVTGIILGAMSFRNGYDGHTIGSSWEQVEWLTGLKIKVIAGDRGYRGKKKINGMKIIIPNVPKKSDSRYQKQKKHKLFCKRAGIEPTISH